MSGAEPGAPRRSIVWPVVIALAVVVFGLLAYASIGRGPTPSAAPAPPPSAPSAAPSGAATRSESAGEPGAPSQAEVEKRLRALPRRDKGDPTALGRPDAKVVMVEYADYRCPFCGLWARQTKPALQTFVDDGTLRIEFRDLPLFGQQSVDVAVAARAAGEQGRFWPYWEAVFAAAPERGHADLGSKELMAFASKAGVPDLPRFTRDLSNPELRKRVDADAAQARELGAGSVPVFIVGLEPISGAQPTEVFVEAVKRQAAAS